MLSTIEKLELLGKSNQTILDCIAKILEDIKNKEERIQLILTAQKDCSKIIELFSSLIKNLENRINDIEKNKD